MTDSVPPSEKIRILIVDDIVDTRENLRKLLQFEADIEVVAQASTGEEGLSLAKQHRPHVVLMDINMPGMDGIAASEAITKDVPATQVVMMSVQSDADYIRRSMLAGARYFLTKPFSGDELLTTLRRVYEHSRDAMARMPAAGLGQGDLLGAEPDSAGGQGKVVTVFSAKGGVGCSVLAANLAVALAQMGRNTVLLDANLYFGDMAVLLDVQGTRSIVDLAEAFEELDADMVRSVLTPHDSGLRVLLAPPRPEMGEMVTSEHLREIISYLRRECEYLIVDTITSLGDTMLTALDEADRILLIATPDIPCVKDTRLFFEVVDQLEYEREKTMLVLNQVDKNAGIRPEDIEKTMKQTVTASVPADPRTVMFSVNRGLPFVVREPGKAISEAVMQLAKQLREELRGSARDERERVAEPAGRPRLGRLFGSGSW